MKADEKEKLGNAIYKLLQDKTLELITVKEILLTAKVSRYQFDKHFGTKKALLEWEYLHLLSSVAKDILGSSCWSEAVFKKFCFYEEHLKFFQHVYQSKHTGHLRLANKRFVHDAYAYMLRHKGADLKNPHIAFAMEMAVYGGEEMTWQWVANGMQAPKEVMLVLFQESIPKCICKYFA